MRTILGSRTDQIIIKCMIFLKPRFSPCTPKPGSKRKHVAGKSVNKQICSNLGTTWHEHPPLLATSPCHIVSQKSNVGMRMRKGSQRCVVKRFESSVFRNHWSSCSQTQTPNNSNNSKHIQHLRGFQTLWLSNSQAGSEKGPSIAFFAQSWWMTDLRDLELESAAP